MGVAMFSEEETAEQLKQDRYASKAECTRDWGSEQHCQETPPGTSYTIDGGGSKDRYRGPRYYWDRSAGHPVMVTDSGVHQPMPSAHSAGSPLSHSTGSVDTGTVTRGGFGHFSFRSGGG